MKNNKFFLAICVMVVAIIVSVAVVSCKKETSSDFKGNKNESMQAFTPPLMDDVDAYLKDFKQKMKSATKGEDDTLSLEEAAWHLSSVANYDFGHANVEYDDIHFDTLYGTVTVTNGTVLLSDLAAAYEQISTDIDLLYHTLSLENKHFRFIGCQISEQGVITIPVVVTFSTAGKWHYFADSTFCDYYFTQDQYVANGNAITELQRVFNLELGHSSGTSGRIYYVYTRTQVFYFKHWIEDEGNYCPNEYNYRLFCTMGYFYDYISKEDMCYYADSYIDLGYSGQNHLDVVLYGEVEMVYGIIPEYEDNISQVDEQQFGHHLLTVNYGIAMSSSGNDY